MLAIIVSNGAFKYYKTVEEVLGARAPEGEGNYLLMEWADDVLDSPVFPVMSGNGPTKKIKNETSWGHQCSDWAIRAGFEGGMGLHAPRREAIIQVDGKGF